MSTNELWFRGLSLTEIVKITQDPASNSAQLAYFGGVKRISNWMVSLLGEAPELNRFKDIPLALWPREQINDLLDLLPDSIQWIEFLAPEQMSSELAVIAVRGGARLSMIPDRVKTEEFWIDTLSGNRVDVSLFFQVPMEQQTQAMVECMIARTPCGVKIEDIRADLLTDRVVGIIMKSYTLFDNPDPELLTRGMRWLMDNGYPDFLEKNKKYIEPKFRNLDFLMDAAIDMATFARERNYYHAMETLRRVPIAELSALVNDGQRADLFRKLHGTEAAFEWLGERAQARRRSWAEEDFSL